MNRVVFVAAFLSLLTMTSEVSAECSRENRTGARCNNGSRSPATGSGACSHNGGVAKWLCGRQRVGISFGQYAGAHAGSFVLAGLSTVPLFKTDFDPGVNIQFSLLNAVGITLSSVSIRFSVDDRRGGKRDTDVVFGSVGIGLNSMLLIANVVAAIVRRPNSDSKTDEDFQLYPSASAEGASVTLKGRF